MRLRCGLSLPTKWAEEGGAALFYAMRVLGGCADRSSCWTRSSMRTLQKGIFRAVAGRWSSAWSLSLRDTTTWQGHGAQFGVHGCRKLRCRPGGVALSSITTTTTLFLD